MDALTFILNDRDDLVAANDAWDIFAAANGGPPFERVRGQPLNSFIKGAELRLLWRHLLGRVRRGVFLEGLRIPWAGSTGPPAIMLTTTLVAHGSIAIHTVPDFRELPPASPLPQDPADSLLHLCSWCHRMKRGGEWVLLEEAVTSLRLLERTTLPTITHGMCNYCYQEIDAALSRLERRR